MKKPIYLDYNATTPVAREVADAMAPYLYEIFGNPSSDHPYGWQAKAALNKARSQVATMLGCMPEEVVFTSGGTESNNYAIKGAAAAYLGQRKHIITSAIEHPAVLNVCRWLEKHALQVTVLPVDEFGRVSLIDFEAAIQPDTVMASIMHANNEIGTLQPIAEMGAIARDHGILFHTDAAQSVGKVPVNVDNLHVDLLSIAGHKLYAPQGVGALYIREGVKLENLLHGGGQENGRRPTTENILEIVGLGKACELAAQDIETRMTNFRTLRDRLHDNLLNVLGEDSIRMNGHPSEKLHNTLSISFYGIRSNDLIAEINNEVAVSAGSACHAGGVTLSNVLLAMGVSEDWGMGTIRFSVGIHTTEAEIDKATGIITSAVKKLRV